MRIRTRHATYKERTFIFVAIRENRTPATIGQLAGRSAARFNGRAGWSSVRGSLFVFFPWPVLRSNSFRSLLRAIPIK